MVERKVVMMVERLVVCWAGWLVASRDVMMAALTVVSKAATMGYKTVES